MICAIGYSLSIILPQYVIIISLDYKTSGKWWTVCPSDGSSLYSTHPAWLITNTESGLCSTRLSLLEGLKCQASIGLTHHYFDLKLDWIKISTIKTNFAPCDFVNLFKNRTLKLSCKALNMKSSLFDISILTIASLLIVYISCAFLQVKNPI